MLIKLVAFVCLSKAQRDEKLPTDDNKTKSDQRKAMEERGITRNNKDMPSNVPVIFDNEHTDGTWMSTNFTQDDSCTYVEQADGSVLISTRHNYRAFDYCHQYWECDNPDHKMFFKWNDVSLSWYSDCSGSDCCREDWARFAWGTEENEQQLSCDFNTFLPLTGEEKYYRNTGGNKIVWDFDADFHWQGWGVEAQIICQDPSDVNECADGTHVCSPDAECIKEIGMSDYICQCSPDGIKWGDQRLLATGAGTISDPCFYGHPNNPSLEVFPIEWDGDTFGVIIEPTRFGDWEEAFVRCNELGMTLPLPSNDEENTAISKILAAYFNDNIESSSSNAYYNAKKKKIWLGAHTSIGVQWTNVYTNEEIKYNKWDDDEPDKTGDGDAVAMMWANEKFDIEYNDLFWYDTYLGYRSVYYKMCIKLDYEDWNPEDVDPASFLCESGLDRCHATATCVPTDELYQCECYDIVADDVELIANKTIVSKGEECKHNLPGIGDFHVNMFMYGGEATVYHYLDDYFYDYYYPEFYNYAHDFDDAVAYCNEIGMHLPVPNTIQQYEDLKKLPRFRDYESIWLGYTPSPSLDTWLNVYNGEELAIDTSVVGIGPPSNGSNYHLEMEQADPFEWNIVYGNYYNYYRATLCIQVRV